MPGHLLQINYRLHIARGEFERQFGPLAPDLAKVPGLRWKIWILNEAESCGGGIYLFDDAASLQSYVNGPIVAAIKSHPAFSDLSAKSFEVMDGLSMTTRGPIQ